MTLILIILAGMFNSLMDLSTEGCFKIEWFNRGYSWRNKWSHAINEEGIQFKDNTRPKWLYLWIFTPKTQERFLYSSTIFVFITDFWHLCQFMYNNCWQLAIAINTDKPLITFIIIKVIYSLVFELFYKNLKNKLS